MAKTEKSEQIKWLGPVEKHYARVPNITKVGYLLAVGVLVFAGILIFIRLMDSPSQSVIKNPGLAPSIAPTPTPLAAVTGKHAAFNYPTSLKTIASESLATNDLEKFSFSKGSNNESIHLEINIRTLPSGNLTDDSSYKMRQIYSDQYQLDEMKINNQTFYVMTDNQATFSKAVFTTHSGLEATIALTANNNDQSIQNILDTVINSWRWL
jgi:hypothetical protein